MQTANKPEAANVKFRFKNLGPVKEAELELGDLTIIAGRNNTGKTYVTYALYGFLAMWCDWWEAAAYSFVRDSLALKGSTMKNLISEVFATGRACWKVDRETLNQERKVVIRELARDFSKGGLAGVFNSPKEAFEEASMEVELIGEFPDNREFTVGFREGEVFSMQYDGTELVVSYSESQKGGDSTEYSSWIWSGLPTFYLYFLVQDLGELEYIPFILSAERFGISLFYKELDFTKSEVLNWLQLMQDEKDMESMSPSRLIDRTSRYALPIKDNIDYTRDISRRQKEKSAIFENKLFDDIKDMMEGYYRSSDDEIRFVSKMRKDRRFNIPLHRASSSARGLSDLYFFLRHVAHKNHLLIIDEPESHLDTANQIEFARLMARLARAGVKVLVTTHSDYIIKEINNLIMLSQSFESKSKLVKKLKYKKNDFLPADSVRAYVAEDSSLTACTIDEFGIDMPFFDKTINDINRVANELATRVAREGVE